VNEHRQQNNRSQQRNRPNQRRNGNNNQQRRKPADIWREAPPLPPLERIVVSEDVGALIRSLGEPPLANATSAGSAFETVAERAAAIARALAVSADLLGDRDG
jgi:hypothetical protein